MAEEDEDGIILLSFVDEENRNDEDCCSILLMRTDDQVPAVACMVIDINMLVYYKDACLSLNFLNVFVGMISKNFL